MPGRWPMLRSSNFSADDQAASSDSIFTEQPDMPSCQVTESKMKNSGSGPRSGRWPMLRSSNFSADDQAASSDSIFTEQPDMPSCQVTESKMKNSGSGPK